MDKLLSIYQEIIQGMTNHVQFCKNPRCCIRLVGESVVLGNYEGIIRIDLPSKKVREKKGMTQVLESESQYHSDQGKADSQVMP